MSDLTDFLLARIAEDEAGNGCYGEGEYETCFRRSERIERECEAKRRIVEEHYFMPRHESRDFGFEDGNCVTCRKQGPCTTLRLLALPYADHPDYREEWRP